jgi:GAF domain-containing protein
MTRSRERQILDTFVTLSDTLVDDYDVVELAQVLVDQSAAVFGAASVGLLLIDREDSADVLASTDEDARLIDLMQLRAGEGPCVECLQTGVTVEVADTRDVEERWPAFAALAHDLGLRSATSVPMRLRSSVIGSLNIFRQTPGVIAEEDRAVVRGFADVATIGIIHQRTLAASETVSAQLEHALRSRVVIEQAKGVVAFAHDVSVDDAFSRLRAYARRNSLPLTDVARRVVALEIDIGD